MMKLKKVLTLLEKLTLLIEEISRVALLRLRILAVAKKIII
jgi:hypothetical protein